MVSVGDVGHVMILMKVAQDGRRRRIDESIHPRISVFDEIVSGRRRLLRAQRRAGWSKNI